MAIKPIENNRNKVLFLKLSFLVFLLGLGFMTNRMIAERAKNKNEQVLSLEAEAKKTSKDAEKTINNFIGQSQSLANDVLGETTNFIRKIASESADAVSNLIIDKATEPIIEQIKKLPQDKQEEIKKIFVNNFCIIKDALPG